MFVSHDTCRNANEMENKEEEINRSFGPLAARLFNLIQNNKIRDVEKKSKTNGNNNLYSCASQSALSFSNSLSVELSYPRFLYSR